MTLAASITVYKNNNTDSLTPQVICVFLYFNQKYTNYFIAFYIFCGIIYPEGVLRNLISSAKADLRHRLLLQTL